MKLNTSIERLVITRLLRSKDREEIEKLCRYRESFYGEHREYAKFIFDYYDKYGDTPDIVSFVDAFDVDPDSFFLDSSDKVDYLVDSLKNNKRLLMLEKTLDTLRKVGPDDLEAVWTKIRLMSNQVGELDESRPRDIIKESEERAANIIDLNKAARIPTGFDEIDKLMYGGLSTVEELCLIVARTNTGKAQPLWSKVLTPTGWKTMGDIKVGDIVVGKNNDNGKVVQIFPQGVKDYYKVTFDDGTFTHCCKDHLWEVVRSTNRYPSSKFYNDHEVLTTEDIINTFDRGYSIDISDAVEFTSAFDSEHELDPYLLGVLIGDGTTRDGRVLLSNFDDEIWTDVEEIAKNYNCYRSGANNDCLKCDNWNENFIRNKLKEYGLLGKKSIDKFIPKIYLTAPINVRMKLLAGLVDTDGYVPKNSSNVWEFDTSSEQLAFDFAELARSLGVRVTLNARHSSRYTANGEIHKGNGTRHLYCRSTFNPFTLSRKHDRLSLRTEVLGNSRPKGHYKKIQYIELVGQTECQCILLDNKSHTYITDDYIVTHNTWVTTKFMESAQAHGFNVLYYSPEMQADYIGARFDTWRGQFKNSNIQRGVYSDEYIHYLKELKDEKASAYVLEDKDMPENEVTVSGLDRLVKELNIKLLIVDGLSYMKDEEGATQDHIKYKNLAAGLFKLSKQNGCAVVVSLQANRETKEEKDDKGVAMPTLYNIESSDAPARICTQAFCMRQIFEQHLLEIRMEKSRTAANTKPLFTYQWNPGDGDMSLYSEDVGSTQPTNTTSVAVMNYSTPGSPQPIMPSASADDDDDEDVEF